jgi:NAD(P)-dependent dehydrogenase (short-subunit alcohol dehydrogenase family)
LASVTEFAARWAASQRPLHVLINNAGVMSYGCRSSDVKQPDFSS